MFVKLLKSKLHRARVTDTKLHYAGSIAVDPELMDQVGLLPYEVVVIADLDNGNRLETYVVPAEPGSGDVIIMGAAAKLIKAGDIVIILNYAYLTPEEVKQHKPKVVVLDEKNEVIEKF